MYKQNFKNQAVKEVTNGSSIAEVSRKFGVSQGALSLWLKEYKEKMYEMTEEKSTDSEPVAKPATGIKLQSIKITINGAIITLSRNDVLKMLELFNIFDERIGEG